MQDSSWLEGGFVDVVIGPGIAKVTWETQLNLIEVLANTLRDEWKTVNVVSPTTLNFDSESCLEFYRPKIFIDWDCDGIFIDSNEGKKYFPNVESLQQAYISQ